MKHPFCMQKAIRIGTWVLAELTAILTVIYQLSGEMNESFLLALATPFLLLLPKLVEKLFRCRLSLPLYLFSLFYALGPMMGQCWKLYYLTAWWDKMLHIFGGILFALVGWTIFHKLCKENTPRLATAVFALCFSVSLSVIWEFLEFGADQFLGMDMQHDSILTEFRSYKLGPAIGVLGIYENIDQVTLNGIDLPFSGYLDIGLHDTMWDMLLESLGALVTALLCYFSKRTSFGFYPK